MWYGKDEGSNPAPKKGGRVVSFGDGARVKLTKENMSEQGWQDLLLDLEDDKYERMRLDDRGWVEFYWETRR